MRFIITLLLLLTTLTLRAEEITLLPGDQRMDGRRLEPFTVLWRYHRADSPDPGAGVRVTQRLEKTGDGWASVMISHFPADQLGDLRDTSTFDLRTLALTGIAAPNMPADEIVDIELCVDGTRVRGTVTGRDSGDVLEVDQTLEGPVFGAGAPYLMALLPVHEGLVLRWPGYDAGTYRRTWHSATVTGRKVVAFDGRPVRVWRVTVDQGELWVLPEPPYVIRREFRISDDVTLVWEVERFPAR